MTSIYLRRKFWSQTLERAVRAFSWSSISLFTGNTTGLADIDVRAWLSMSGMVVLLSVLASLSGARVGDDSPSFVSR